jgi:hypothetical protein
MYLNINLKYMQKKYLLLIVVIIGYLFAISFSIVGSEFSGIYGILNWILPFITTWMVMSFLFSPKSYKKTRLQSSKNNKTADYSIRIVLTVFTAIISWVVLVYIGFSSGTYSSSTYGTPIHRPKTR